MKGSLMDWVDEVVRNAAPPPLGDDSAVAEQAAAVARAVVAAQTRERARISRLRGFLGGTALGIGVLGLGVTAATAGPAVFAWLGWTPDVVAQRSFELGDGSEPGLCEVFIRVIPEYHDISNEEADRRTEEARKFLTGHDWEPLIASITESEIQTAFAEEVARRSAALAGSTTPPPATLSGAATDVMFDRFSAEFERAGHLQHGVSLEAAAGPCGDTSDGPTQ
ncbi:hypothetical protein [Agromyces ramosus]|uniref:Uncharacterized protein n=1 Tax=Agromyces ramosus TaxID=33879 RepID=A0ABU0R6C3_9MICO|nr:hypothetical protein [Agromyces ramosus]MDQ0893618.1 hypothetical protein [Agromyces ramosus]